MDQCPDCGGELLLDRTRIKRRLIAQCSKCFGWSFPTRVTLPTEPHYAEPSVESLAIVAIGNLPVDRASWGWQVALAIDALAARRVSEETERCCRLLENSDASIKHGSWLWKVYFPNLLRGK
jgi:hypothetical protein